MKIMAFFFRNEGPADVHVHNRTQRKDRFSFGGAFGVGLFSVVVGGPVVAVEDGGVDGRLAGRLGEDGAEGEGPWAELRARREGERRRDGVHDDDGSQHSV